MRWREFDIPDQAILTYIENSPRMLHKVRQLIGRINGQSTKLDAEQRIARASNASKKRWRDHKKSLNGETK